MEGGMVWIENKCEERDLAIPVTGSKPVEVLNFSGFFT